MKYLREYDFLRFAVCKKNIRNIVYARLKAVFAGL